ncbi:TetR/AcrR family transcriptional regulator [Agreia sp. PsM10]|uniref:TetR/AcrR family transcriptional regulator n=1 Tax=Agreia sp. PsM10 TaxID=3030533 RepID=UPI00263B6978|nr:TetR/AcrR family transcriptional regulator [Agreia sp. PsM10]MDN4640498.1 TetR/AcrR family transcriptional regulator [Agreia sp. PsM10]
MSEQAPRPTRRQERRSQTVQEIKTLALQQVSAGGPDAVTLSGIVREMAMSPAALYRYFASRDALLADLVVDAYDDFADSVLDGASDRSDAGRHLVDVLNAARDWALANPNAYRLIFQTGIGSGQELAPERTIPAASRSMTTIVEAIAAVAEAEAEAEAGSPSAIETETVAHTEPALDTALQAWAERSQLAQYPRSVLLLGLTAWTRLHGIMSLELGGHLPATGIDAGLLYAAEVASIREQAERAGRRAG